MVALCYRKSDAMSMHSRTPFSIWQLARKPDCGTTTKDNFTQAVPLLPKIIVGVKGVPAYAKFDGYVEDLRDRGISVDWFAHLDLRKQSPGADHSTRPCLFPD